MMTSPPRPFFLPHRAISLPDKKLIIHTLWVNENGSYEALVPPGRRAVESVCDDLRAAHLRRVQGNIAGEKERGILKLSQEFQRVSGTLQLISGEIPVKNFRNLFCLFP